MPKRVQAVNPYAVRGSHEGSEDFETPAADFETGPAAHIPI